MLGLIISPTLPHPTKNSVVAKSITGFDKDRPGGYSVDGGFVSVTHLTGSNRTVLNSQGATLPAVLVYTNQMGRRTAIIFFDSNVCGTTFGPISADDAFVIDGVTYNFISTTNTAMKCIVVGDSGYVGTYLKNELDNRGVTHTNSMNAWFYAGLFCHMFLGVKPVSVSTPLPPTKPTSLPNSNPNIMSNVSVVASMIPAGATAAMKAPGQTAPGEVVYMPTDPKLQPTPVAENFYAQNRTERLKQMVNRDAEGTYEDEIIDRMGEFGMLSGDFVLPDLPKGAHYTSIACGVLMIKMDNKKGDQSGPLLFMDALINLMDKIDPSSAKALAELIRDQADRMNGLSQAMRVVADIVASRQPLDGE